MVARTKSFAGRKPKAKAPIAKAAEPVVRPVAEQRKATPPRAKPVAEEIAAPAIVKAIDTPPVPETPAAIIQPIQKEVKTMEATVKNAADKAQTVFAEANDRAQTAMEKGSKMFETMNDFAKGNVEAIVESSKIAAKGFETIGQDTAEYTRKSFEGMTATMKSFAGVKSPTELFKLQGDYMRQAFDSLVAETSKNTEAMLKLAGDVAQPLSNRAAVAVEKIKIAA